MTNPIQRPVVRPFCIYFGRIAVQTDEPDTLEYLTEKRAMSEHNTLHDYTLHLEQRVEGLKRQLAEAEQRIVHLNSELELSRGR